MKKRNLQLLLTFGLLIPCLVLFSACKIKLNSFNLTINLNGGSYTQEYKEAKGYSSNNVTHILNPDRYDLIVSKLPVKGDMIAPTGKVFAGWYLTRECDADSYFNETNWKDLVAEKKAAGAKSGAVYAYWIDDTDVSLSFDLNNEDATLKDEYKTELSIDHNSARFVGTVEEVASANLPELTDINVPEGKVFAGWYLNEDLTIMLNTTTIGNMATQSADLRVYAKWTNRLEVSAHIFAAPDDSEEPLASFVFSESVRAEYDDDIFAGDISYTVYRDEFVKVQTLLSTLPTQIETNGSSYTFDAWKIATWRNGSPVLLDFNETNWLEETNVSASQSFTSIWIYATWTQIGA